MGKGIGFKAHTGDAIDDSRVEKVFRIENEKLSRQFQEILENIPLEHMQLTSEDVYKRQVVRRVKIEDAKAEIARFEAARDQAAEELKRCV